MHGVARKDRSEAETTGRRELFGVALVGLGVFFLVSLFSYDHFDLDFNRIPANSNIHNLVGRIGARTAFSLFFTFGAAAYLFPVLLLAFGLACFVSGFSYLFRSWRSWIGLAGLMISRPLLGFTRVGSRPDGCHRRRRLDRVRTQQAVR